MSQLSDVEVLYELMGATHVPYREIKFEESKERSNTVWPLLNEIDLSHVEILPITISGKIRPSLAGMLSISPNSIEPFILSNSATESVATHDAIGTRETSASTMELAKLLVGGVNFASNAGINSINEVPFDLISVAPESLLKSKEVNEIKLEILPIDINNSAVDAILNSVKIPQIINSPKSQLTPNEANERSEMSSLILRIKHSSEKNKTISKQSFFESLRAE